MNTIRKSPVTRSSPPLVTPPSTPHSALPTPHSQNLPPATCNLNTPPLERSRKRPPLERMKKIYDRLQAGAYPNCATLARELEVSPKTAHRDLDFMRDRFQWPIEYDEHRYGFYFSRPVDTFPGAPVTEAELFALLVAHKAIEQYQGTPFQKPLDLAFRKLTGQLDRHDRYTLDHLGDALSFRPFAPEDADLRAFEIVTNAVTERRALVFQYKKPGEKIAETRSVHPYHLLSFENRWYLLAWDTNRRQIRTFVLGRMRKPVLTPERFLKPHDFDPRKHFDRSLGVMTGAGDFCVVIEMDAWLTDVLRGRRWHPSQVWTRRSDGRSRLRLRLSCLEEIEQWILSWGAHATVTAPQELINRISNTARTLAARYAPPNSCSI